MSRIESDVVGKNERFNASSLIQRSQRAIEKAVGHEREWKVAYVDTKVREGDIKHLTRWYQDKESAKHFVPPLAGVGEVEDYYFNPSDKMFFVARNTYGEPLGISSLLRKNPYLKGSNRKTVYTEKTIVDPKKRQKNIGTILRATINDYIFSLDKSGKPRFEEAHLYIMTDKDAGDWRVNYEFFISRLGYAIHKKHPQWREYAEEVWGLKGERQALLLVITGDMWEKAKIRNPKLHSAELRLAA